MQKVLHAVDRRILKSSIESLRVDSSGETSLVLGSVLC